MLSRKSSRDFEVDRGQSKEAESAAFDERELFSKPSKDLIRSFA